MKRRLLPLSLHEAEAVESKIEAKKDPVEMPGQKP
jgi:hypothetical protein